MPSALFPAFTLKVAGAVYNLYGHNGYFDEAVFFSKDGRESLVWHVLDQAQPPPEASDPFRGRSVSLDIDTGSGPVRRFTGACVDRQVGWTPRGWGRTYTAVGLRELMDRFPVTDSNTLSDSSAWNLDLDTPGYIAARTGRTLGDILRQVLEMPAHNAALTAVGIGGFLSSGSGCTASCSVSGGAVQNTINVANGGKGYNGTETVLFVGGGGSGATGTVVVSNGVVTAINVTNGGTNYTTAPLVWVSPLPLATLQDLAALLVQPPTATYIQGEKFGESLEGTIRAWAPNHAMFVLSSGLIRILDTRAYSTALTLTMGVDRVDVAAVQFTQSDRDCFTRVVARGQSPVEGVIFQTSDSSLVELFGHDGLDVPTAKLNWKLGDYTTPSVDGGAAAATPTIGTGASAGQITGGTVTNGGYNYGTAPRVRVTGNGTGATAHATLSGSSVATIVVDTPGSGYTTAAFLIDAPGGGSQDAGSCTCPSSTQIVCTPVDSTKTWGANYWDQTSTGRKGVVMLNYSVGSDINAKTTAKIISNTPLAPGTSPTSTLTLDRALPTTLYDSYVITGYAGGGSIVYRRYQAANAALGATFTDDQFTYPTGFVATNGAAETLCSFNAGMIEWSSTGNPPYQTCPVTFTVDATTGTVDLAIPSVVPFGTRSKLVAGGNNVDGVPSNVKLLIGCRKTQLTATCPADVGSGSAVTPQYQGTAYTDLGIQRTLTVTVPSWRDRSNLTNMQSYACELLDSVKNIVTEGTVPYLGFYEPAITPGATLRLVGSGYSFPVDTLNLPILECRLKWLHDAESGIKYRTDLKVSNRKAHFTGQQYLRPTPAGFLLGGADGVFIGGGFSLGNYSGENSHEL